jgi:hypothetical protein
MPRPPERGGSSLPAMKGTDIVGRFTYLVQRETLMAHRHLKMFASMMAVAGCVILLGAGPAYTLKLDRPMKAGNAYDTHWEIEQTQTVSITVQGAAQPQQQEITKGDLKGSVRVGKVDAKGVAIELSITIKSLTDGSGKSLIEAGKVVDIKRGEKQVDIALQGGGEISDGAKKVLTAMYPAHTTADTSDDDVFNSGKAQSVGDSWPVHSEAMITDLNRQGFVIEAKNVSGQTTLKGVEKVDGKDALRVASAFTMKNVKTPTSDPSMTVDDCTMDGHLDGLFPVDTSMAPAESTVMMDMTLRMSSKANPVKMEVKAHQSRKETITQTKK